MKHKTWVRLLLKVIGIYMIVSAIPSMLSQSSSILLNLTYYQSQQMMTGTSYFEQWHWWIPQLLHWGAQIGIGLYLLLGGRWLVDLCIPSNRPYCPDCGYDLSRSASATCPECGCALSPELASAKNWQNSAP